jgi:AraC-like DNA-binding protein
MRRLVDRVLTLEEVTGRPAPHLSDDAPETVRGAVIAFLTPFLGRDDTVVEVNALVARASTDREIARAEDLARVAGISVRSLHRLFERYVGVGPKWIIRRSRVQEAAERVAQGERIDWARTAQDLGYHDQAHLIRDFRAQIGFTPAAYARRCARPNDAPLPREVPWVASKGGSEEGTPIAAADPSAPRREARAEGTHSDRTPAE